MTVNVTKPVVRVNEQLEELKIPSGVAGREVLATDNSLQKLKSTGAGLYNFVRNGDFSVAQRGTSFTFSPNAGAYTLDGWYADENTGGEISIDRTTETIYDNGQVFKYVLKLTVDVADTSVTGSEYGMITHKIEGEVIRHLGWGTVSGTGVTVQFWHKHSYAGTYCVNIRNSAANRTFIREYTQTIPNQWEKTVVTYPFCADGGWEYGNLTGMRLDFCYSNGTTYQNNTANKWLTGTYYHATANQTNIMREVNNTFQLAGVQMVEGIHPDGVPWMARNPQEELAFNQRYCIVLNADAAYSPYGFVGFCESTTRAKTIFTFPVPMRAAPTLERNGSFSYDGASTNPSFSSLNAASTTKFMCRIEDNVTSGTTGEGVLLINNNDADAEIILKAEL